MILHVKNASFCLPTHTYRETFQTFDKLER